jgi:hypothetical protein
MKTVPNPRVKKVVIAHPAERWDGGFQIGVSEGLIFG